MGNIFCAELIHYAALQFGRVERGCEEKSREEDAVVGWNDAREKYMGRSKKIGCLNDYKYPTEAIPSATEFVIMIILIMYLKRRMLLVSETEIQKYFYFDL